MDRKKHRVKVSQSYKAPEIHLRFQSQELYIGFLELAAKVNQYGKKKMSHNALLNALVAQELCTPNEERLQDRLQRILIKKRSSS